MHNGLVVVNWMLCDQDPSTGGFVRPAQTILVCRMLTAQHLPAQACVPGTHKSNLRGPPSLYTYEEHQDLVHQEVCKAGDGTAVVLAQMSP